MDTKLFFDDIYKWEGGFGCWFSSTERTRVVRRGDVRCIRDELFEACYLYPFFKWPWTSRRSRVCWVIVSKKNDIDIVHRFKNSL